MTQIESFNGDLLRSSVTSIYDAYDRGLTIQWLSTSYDEVTWHDWIPNYKPKINEVNIHEWRIKPNQSPPEEILIEIKKIDEIPKEIKKTDEITTVNSIQWIEL